MNYSRKKLSILKRNVAFIILSVSFLFSANLSAVTNKTVKTGSASTNISKNIVLPEFQYTLAQAKKAGYPKTVALIENEDYAKALVQLNNEFLKEPIEGYKKGFFNEALKGICLEKSDKVVEAYRAYQNARYYCDEEKTGVLDKPLPALKLELYIGIGRMCNKAGRYTDALAYLDNARMEAAEYPSVAVVADYDLIERAMTLVDFEEADVMFQDLYELKKLRRKDYSDWAEILFMKNQDRKAFEILSEGIVKFRSEKVLGLNDPIFRTFVNKLIYATDQDILLLYTVLGDSLANTQLFAGNERSLAAIILTRKTLAKNFKCLTSEDDLLLIKKRINAFESTIQTDTKSLKKKRIYKSKKKRRVKTKNVEYEHKYEYEDMLMSYDRGKRSKELFDAFNYIISNKHDFAEIYDDTSIANAAQIALASLNKNDNKIFWDGSIRAFRNVLKQWKKEKNNEKKLELETYIVSIDLPSLNKYKIEYYYNKLDQLLKAGNYSEYVSVFEEGYKLCPGSFAQIFHRLSAVYLQEGQTEKAFSVLLRAARNIEDDNDWDKVKKRTLEYCPFASDKDLDFLAQMYPKLLVISELLNESDSNNLAIRDWKRNCYILEKRIRNNLYNKDYQKTLGLLMPRFNQPSHDLKRAICYAGLGETNKAFQFAESAYQKRCKIISELIPKSKAKPINHENNEITNFITSNQSQK